MWNKKDNDSERPNRPDRGSAPKNKAFGNDRPSYGGNRNNDSDRRPRSEGNDRPRFERKDNDRPSYGGNRNNDSDRRPRPEGNDRPRFERKDNDRPSYGGNRNNDSDRRPRPEGNDRPRFERKDNDRPSYGGNRNNDSDRRPRPEGNDRPRFERKDNDRPSYGGNRNNDSDRRPRPEGNDRPRFERKDNDRPSYGGNRNNDSDRRPRPEGNDRPRFERKDNDRPSYSGNRNNDSDRRPRPEGNDRPRFERKDSGFSKSRPDTDFRRPRSADDKPRFEREGFSRGEDSRDSDRTRRPRTENKPRFVEGDSRRVGGKKPNYDEDRLIAKLPPKVKEKIESKHTDGSIRLNRYIANAGVCSRREADELIANEEIMVNGKVVTEMGYRVKDEDTVKYKGQELNRQSNVYVLLNKPKDYITTTEDPEERKTVMELVSEACFERIYPVGRLDRNTTGLLLLTNDGELAERLSHPSNSITKIYQVEIDKPITEAHFEEIKKGLELEDGFIKPDDLAIVTPDAEVIGIEIHSGKNRIVRRIFEHLGYEVLKLDRTVYAGLNKKELPRGKWRFLTEKEVIRLKYMNL